MIHALILALAATPQPTASPDVRTAIATEHLVTATWALVKVGILTLVAAIVAAIVAVNAYRLEAQPGLVITGRRLPPSQDTEVQDGFQITRYVKRRNDRTEASSTVWPPVRLMPFLRYEERDQLLTSQMIMMEVRNVGRTPVIEAAIFFRFTVPELLNRSDGSSEMTNVVYRDSARVKAVPPNAAVILPLLNTLGTGLQIEIERVTGLTLAKDNRRRAARRLHFSSGTVLVPPP